MGFFSLLTTMFSSVFYGLVLTVAVMAVLYLLLKSFSKSIVRTPVFFVIGVILAMLLVVNCSMLIGAIQAKGLADSAEMLLNQLVCGMGGMVNVRDSQLAMDAVAEELPLLGVFANLADFSGVEVSELPAAMHQAIVDYLNSYIWRRVGWIVGFIVVACLLAMFFDKKALGTGRSTLKTTAGRTRRNYDDF